MACIFSYKKLNRLPKILNQLIVNRSILESLMIQIYFDQSEFKWVYFDEFKISSRHHQFYGWTPIGKPGYVSLFDECLDLSVIVAFSTNVYYGI